MGQAKKRKGNLMHVELKGKVKFKPWAVFQHNLITGEVKFIQDFDTKEEAGARAEGGSGILVRTVYKFVRLGSASISETIDSQAGEAEWKRRKGEGLVMPPGGMRV